MFVAPNCTSEAVIVMLSTGTAREQPEHGIASVDSLSGTHWSSASRQGGVISLNFPLSMVRHIPNVCLGFSGQVNVGTLRWVFCGRLFRWGRQLGTIVQLFSASPPFQKQVPAKEITRIRLE